LDLRFYARGAPFVSVVKRGLILREQENIATVDLHKLACVLQGVIDAFVDLLGGGRLMKLVEI